MSRFIWKCGLLSVFLLLSISGFADVKTSHLQRTIFYNGKVFTSVPGAGFSEGVVVQGRFILKVGTSAEVLQYQTPGATLIDLEGKTLLPGFNDAHVHPFDVFSYDKAVFLNDRSFVPGPGPSISEVQALIQQGVQANPPGTWLFVTVGTQALEDPNFNRNSFDNIAPDHPVLLGSWFGHGTLLNLNAMQTVGISETEPDPVGGFYGRFHGTNILNGVLYEYAEHHLRRYFASQMSDATLKMIYENFADQAAKAGYTSVQEFSVGIPQDRHTNLVEASNIPIRWRAICFPLALDEPCEVPFSMAPERPFVLKKAGGIKWINDGTPIERFSYLRNDYADDPGNSGRLNFTEAQILNQFERSKFGPRRREQLMIHTTGDALNDILLADFDQTAPDVFWSFRRPRFEHGSLLVSDQFASAASKGVHVVTNPLLYTLTEVFDARFQSTQREALWPFKSLLDNGIHVAIGSDSIIVPSNPFLDLLFAIFHPSNPAESVTLEQAVIAYTKGAAEAEFEESVKGTLEPGKFADLIVLSQDIFTVNPGLLPATQVVLTMVDGNIIYQAPN